MSRARHIIALFAILAVTAVSGLGQTAGTKSDTTMTYDRPAVFLLALGTDTATASKIANSLAHRLTQMSIDLQASRLSKAHYNPKKVRWEDTTGLHTWFVPEGDWSVADYLQQCQNDEPHTLGAYIVLPPTKIDQADNYIAIQRTKTTVSFSLLIAKCVPHRAAPASPAPEAAAKATATPQVAVDVVSPSDGSRRTEIDVNISELVAPSPTPAATKPPGGDSRVVLVSDPVNGVAGRTQFEFFPLAMLTTIYLAFAPQKAFSETTTTSFAPPPTPIAINGYRSSVTNGSTNTINPSNTSGLQGNILNSFSGNGIGTVVGQIQAPDLQFAQAADDAMGHLLPSIESYCISVVPGTGATPPPDVPLPVPPMTTKQDQDICSWLTAPVTDKGDD